MLWLRRAAMVAALGCLCVLPPATVNAQDPADRVIEISYTPTDRAQIAIWIEKAGGTFMRTVRLTDATARRGIGNRPGATQMNSGFHWPYGRREGVLPVWGHRRMEAEGNEPFPRVIFQDRDSEGFASRTSADASQDDYYCLSFDAETTRKDALDAVTCASVFNSDKGRYLTDGDVGRGYAEPWQKRDGSAEMRQLPLGSLYPPRRDVERCTAVGCNDHADVAGFKQDAREVMPHIDAVTMATPEGDSPQSFTWKIPAEWPNGEYVVWLEINVEGDHNHAFNPDIYPTPTKPESEWDHWAVSFGYPYRSQPSVVYRLPFTLSAMGGDFQEMELVGYGALHGEDGEMRDMDGKITDDPTGSPGSGADRLRGGDTGPRMQVEVIPTAVCDQVDPPPECGQSCTVGSCSNGLVCGGNGTCVGMCDAQMPPPAVDDLAVETHPDKKEAHHYATLRFRAPAMERETSEYQVRYSAAGPIDDEQSFERAQEARKATLEGERLVLPTDARQGQLVEADFGVLTPQTHYWVAVRPVDVCGQAGPILTGEVTTTEIHFTTVSPCFVATAAHGSPMADEVGVLRRLRDRHLQSNAFGRALVDAYYEVGPYAADAIRGDDRLRAITRAALSPVVGLANLLD